MEQQRQQRGLLRSIPPLCLAIVATALPLRGFADTNCVTPPSDLVNWWTGEGSASGRAGLAFAFDGNNDAVQLGNPASLQLQNLTIEAWIKRASTSASSLVT